MTGHRGCIFKQVMCKKPSRNAAGTLLFFKQSFIMQMLIIIMLISDMVFNFYQCHANFCPVILRPCENIVLYIFFYQTVQYYKDLLGFPILIMGQRSPSFTA